MRIAAVAGALALLAAAAHAQEPRPATLDAEAIRGSGGVQLTYAWRFAPGDDAERARPGLDDGGWAILEPGRAGAGDTEVAWFRRHLAVDRDLVGVPVVLRIAAPGRTEVFLDGELVLAATGGADDRASALVTTRFDRPTAVLAVRRECAGCPKRFHLQLESTRAEVHRLAQTVAEVAFATIPLVLALLHVGLYLSDRRARENLFLALSLASFAGIVAFSAAADLGQAYAALDAAARLVTPCILGAVFFTQMTYYSIRRQAWPRTWMAFAAAGAVLAVATFLVASSDFRNAAWSLFFLATLVDEIRVEHRSPTRPETNIRPLGVAMVVLTVAIVLQVLVVTGAIPARFPWDSIYLVGLIAFAVGSSIFTVKSFAATRRRLERNEGEIASARKLQQAMLPRALPAVPGLDLAAHLETATDVGGDTYDFHRAPDGTLLLAVGDAAGHGLAAGAMVTAMKALFATVRGDEPLAEILARSDAVLRRMDVRLVHMCLVLVRFRPDAVEVCSAAMPPPLLHRAATGTVEEIGPGSLPLGSALPGRWQSHLVPFGPGDTLAVASDGLAELLDPAGRAFGFDRVAEALARAAGSGAGGTAREVIAAMIGEAKRWRGNAPLADDVTIVVARREG